jgi:hypothetical protein
MNWFALPFSHFARFHSLRFDIGAAATSLLYLHSCRCCCCCWKSSLILDDQKDRRRRRRSSALSHAQILTRVPRMKTGRQTSPHSFRGTWTLETSVKWELCRQLLYRHFRRRGIYHHRRQPAVTIWFHKFIGRFSLIQKTNRGNIGRKVVESHRRKSQIVGKLEDIFNLSSCRILLIDIDIVLCYLNLNCDGYRCECNR